MALVGSEVCFDHCREQLALQAALDVTAKAVERHAEAIGAEVEAGEQAEIRRAKQLQLPAVCAPAVPILYIEMDGTGVPVVKPETEGRAGKVEGQPAHTREVKLGCVFTQTVIHNECRPVRDEDSTIYVAAIENAENFGLRLYTQAWHGSVRRVTAPGCESRLGRSNGGPPSWSLASGGLLRAQHRIAQCLLCLARDFTIDCEACRLTRRTAGCGPACPVVWEGRSREVPPYPDRLCRSGLVIPRRAINHPRRPADQNSVNCANCGSALRFVEGKDHMISASCRSLHFPEPNDDGVHVLGEPSDQRCPVCRTPLVHAAHSCQPLLYCQTCRVMLLNMDNFLTLAETLRARNKSPAFPFRPVEAADLQRAARCR